MQVRLREEDIISNSREKKKRPGNIPEFLDLWCFFLKNQR